MIILILLLCISTFLFHTTQFITETGGQELDSESEIQQAVTSAMGSLDVNEDNVLKAEDLSKFWIAQGKKLFRI